MDKNKLHVVIGMAVASLGVICLGHVVSAGNDWSKQTEKPLAGLAVSFDKYCEDALQDMELEEASEVLTKVPEQDKAEGVAQTNAVVQQTGTSDQSAQSTTVQATVTATPAQSTTVQATVTATPAQTATPAPKKIKLNLVYDRLGVVQVKNYVNVRKRPSENAKIVGKMTNNSGCHVYKIKKGWAKIVSGGVRGFVKASYLITDEKAEAKAQKVATLRATVTTETLNVRYLPSTKANVFDQISADEDYKITRETLTKGWLDEYIRKNVKKSQLKGIDKEKMYADLNNWVMIAIDDDRAFVSKDFIKMTYNLNRAVSIKEVGQSKKSGKKGGSRSQDRDSGSSSGASSLISYAMQFLGNRYVYGGTSLTNGTDCSGFTQSVLANFGISISRTAASQSGGGTAVDMSNLQPGDLLFYDNGSGIGHVSMYIGNGQVVHASNEQTGIIVSSVDYRTACAARSYF